ncbi:serine protease inhibitor Cvsi-2-like [Mytilus californianus]|uniref:serine protease inhibitor Cvsi-2-like n=1 Tax=Mytilus californianus TaxID=6549 RepID=UPI002247F292|nr:serine protease inhibitor Cvsi-2-like [Mytilus californianus]
MKVTILCFVVLIAAVYAENCHMASDCTMETCSSGGMVECQHGVCTCGTGGGGPGGCTAQADCHGHCPHGHGMPHCVDGKCECRH